MKSKTLKTNLNTAALAVVFLLLGAYAAVAAQQVNLTAGPTSLTMPDGSTVPMWGYSCGATVGGSTATCANLNGSPTTSTSWSPVIITIPTGQDLQINLTNHLSFGATPNNIPTSLVIVGQVGGGLGSITPSSSPDNFTASPDHSQAQAATTWPIPGGAGTTPPVQGPRVQSFSTQVAAVPASDTTTLATQLIWTAPRPGTYLLESGTHPSIQVPMGLYGMVVVTSAPSTTAGTAYPGVSYNAEAPILLSEIDPVQNSSVNAAVNTTGFSETAVWSGQPNQCGNPSSTNYHTCYPPAVNYTPLYYLTNGVAFNTTKGSNSLFAASQGTSTGSVTGTVLVRFVNAGLRMHVPSIVGAQTIGETATGGSATVPGFSLIAEDGNPHPGVPRVQSEVFMSAGKTYDVMINVPAAGAPALGIFDRELSLSGNATARQAGMQAYISINGAQLPAAPILAPAIARNDTYASLVSCAAAPCASVVVSDPSKGVIANDTRVTGVQVLTVPAGGTLNLYVNGTFTYVPNAGTTADSFTYCANGSVTAGICSSGVTATVTLSPASVEAANGITVNPDSFTSKVSTYLSVKPPGILANDTDGAGYPLTVAGYTAGSGLTLAVDPNGGFNASISTACTVATGCNYTFTYSAKNSQGTVSASTATVTLTFLPASNLAVTVLDGADKTTKITDYRWIIEEDRTFYIDPKCQVNPPPAGCATPAGIVPTLGTNFHTSYMPLVAQGCVAGGTAVACESGQTVLDPTTGMHVNAVCDIGNGICRPGNAQTPLDPGQVVLDPTRRYYISVLPGDAANPFNTGNAVGGHGMGGASIPAPCAPKTTCTATFAPITVLVEPTPFQPAKLSVQVFEDDFPLNGEQDAGGGIDVLATNEPGLGGFNIILFDDAGGTGDATGQMTYDMFNMPLSNSLAGSIDPATGNDACPISKNSRQVVGSPDSPTGITGMIVTCPKYESDGTTLSPLAGQAVVANLMPGRYGVVATPGADRIARGEEWLQTNTLDGQKAHDSFLRVGEPAYFQEYGPAGYHVSIGFANPTIINSRLAGVCNGSDPNLTGTICTNTLSGMVTDMHYSRTPDERLYSSGSYDSYSFTQCYVSVGDPDGEDFAFTKCASDGSFSIPHLPDGNWRVTVFDQWNDMLVDGLSTPVRLDHTNSASGNLGQIATNQWQANIYTDTFFDNNGNGLRDPGESGLTLVATNVRFRDGSFSNFNNTDLDGYAGFNEVFPLFNWYVIETDSTRYKNTGTHVVYDAGGPVDGTPCGSSTNPPTAPCEQNSTIANNLANTVEQVSLPTSLRVPGAVYCATADCTNKSISSGPASSDPPSNCTTDPNTGATSCSTILSTGRIDPPWVVSEGWQGFSGQNSFVEFGKKPFAVGENGGIRGHVVYASTRPFDDPQLLLQLSWEPLVPNVTINLYQEGTAADGRQTLTLVDTTKTSSWDDWAQGFRSDGVPNMNCPGQFSAPTSTAAGDLFFFSLYNQPMWLDEYNNVLHGTSTSPSGLPDNSQFKCYDGMHNWNQVQPAPYDGMYQFPSIVGRNPTTGAPTGTGSTNGKPGSQPGTNCTICAANPTDGTPMLPAGKYVVEVVVPPGYELVKEEDKNILIGDNYIAPVTQEFGGLSNIFILPDQAEVGDTSPWGAPSPSLYNANNAQNPTQNLGRLESMPSHEGDTGSVETFWPCVGAPRIVPDYISLYPQSGEVAPFAGATRNLCDRKEVTLEDQSSALAKFYIFTSTHAAAHFTGVITDDFTSEFDPFSPTFGEKFSPANQPVSIRDFNYNEISRIYSDPWGDYDGLTYSTWEVNPPNPTGYAPTMMVTCMNDAGPIPDPAHPGQTMTDPLFNPLYSQFCYEIPFMPGQTQYMDTPVVPTAAFVGAGYNNPDCAYQAATPAIKEVDGDGVGPWVSASGHTLTITALGDQVVNNYGYSGPSANTVPFNQKTVSRHYGFGTRCTSPSSSSATCNTVSSVKIGGVAATIGSWSDTQITVTVPSTVPTCAMQQQPQYTPTGTTTARCGELVITAGNGKQSVDAVSVTIGGKAPTHVAAGQSIQAAIDAAAPGDLIIVDPTCTTTAGAVSCTTAGAAHAQAVYNELLLMWKPVRLQGVGAASSIISASTHPAGAMKLDPWRRSVDCLFGLALNGQPLSGANPFDANSQYTCPTGATGINSQPGPNGNTWNYFYGGPNFPQMVVDRIPLEGILGWDTTVNGNLAEMLQEPSLMGAYEGSAITVLGKGVNIPAGSTDVYGSGAEAGFPAGSTLLKGNAANCGQSRPSANGYVPNPFPSNFLCNPSSIDGLGITDSSQGGGGILVHAWGHNLQIANNRIYNNAGTLSGGITVGQGETPDAYLAPNSGVAAPGSCQDSAITNTQLPYCFNLNVNVHNNMVTNNSSTGDELFSSTPAGAGGVTFCTGDDYYQFNYNWVCGNLSTGDGGGLAHLGFSYNGDIEHNTILFNQSTNPTVPTNGGGIMVMGAPPDGNQLINGVLTECGSVTDNDCVPGLGDGTGPGLVINANLIMGNGAESGSGGGIRFQAVNGTDVPRFPNPGTCTSQANCSWYVASVTNNIIADNVAGWDGAGISMEDSLLVNIVNNTIVSNDSTASAGILFNTLGAPLASSQSPPPSCPGQASGTGSCPQPAGLVSLQNSPQLVSSFTTGAITCPAGHFAPGTSASNGTCTKASYPLLYDNMFWQNRTFDIHVGALGTGETNQQNVIALLNGLTGTVPASQTSTGSCPAGSTYWDIGVRGDTGPTNHSSGVTLAPVNSVLTDITGYSSATLNNTSSNPLVVSQYCDGSRVPPENGGLGYNVPAGIADATMPNPIFSLTPTATVDEGNNWINMSWGPLSLTNPVTGAVLGNYSLQSTSPAINFISCSGGGTCVVSPGSGFPTITVPNFDIFGTARPDSGRRFDVGAVEFPGR